MGNSCGCAGETMEKTDKEEVFHGEKLNESHGRNNSVTSMLKDANGHRTMDRKNSKSMTNEQLEGTTSVPKPINQTADQLRQQEEAAQSFAPDSK